MTHPRRASESCVVENTSVNLSATSNRTSRRELNRAKVVVLVLAVATIWRLPYVSPLASTLALFGIPTYIVLTTTKWQTPWWRERVALSVAAAVGLVMAVGLIIDIILPNVGISRPLERTPVGLSITVTWAILWYRRRASWSPLAPDGRGASLKRVDLRMVLAAGLVVLAAVAGAIRLNNGAGSGMATLAYALDITVVLACVLWRHRLASWVPGVVVYCVTLASLLSTSLRGWYITGHDIQHEYFVFQSVATAGRWDFSTVRDPYNACLSITILPAMALRITGIDAPYIYKLLFQVIFAFSGVVTYAIAARLLSNTLALLAVMFYVAFPTFLNDMPFLNRQEIAFLFSGCCFLLFTMTETSVHRRRWWLLLLSAATIVSHYSTSYLLLAVLGIVKLADLSNHFLRARGRPRTLRPERKLGGNFATSAQSPLTLLGFSFVLVICAAWGSGSAQSNAHLSQTATEVLAAIEHSPDSSRSADASYSVVSIKSLTDTDLLHAYITSTLPPKGASRAVAAETARHFPAQVIETPDIPVTSLGQGLGRLGLSPQTLNATTRSVSARLLQFLVVIGLAVTLVHPRYRRRAGRGIISLAVGSVIVVGLQVVLPVVSQDYGLLRAFQQALLVLSPLVVIGSIYLFRIVGLKFAKVITAALTVVLFASLSGLLPQLLGGYPPQLALNNAGQYYNLYYSDAEDISAARWMQSEAPNRAVSCQPILAGILGNYTPLRYAGDIYPTLLQNRGSLIVLGYEQVKLRQETVTIDGDFVTYRYPIQFLTTNRDLVLSNPHVRIYQ